MPLRRWSICSALSRHVVQGIRCPRCGHNLAWMSSCGEQTSVTAGTFMHGSKVARKLLSLGSYKAAWLLCANLRRAMIDPTRSAVRRRRLG